MKKYILITIIVVGFVVFCQDCCGHKYRANKEGITLFATPIEKILAAPQLYEHRRAVISGEVTKTMGLGKKGTFQVSDKTGAIWVVSNCESVPPKGSKVRIHGYTNQVLRLGETSLIVFEQTE